MVLAMDNLHTGQLSFHFLLTRDQHEAENFGPGGFFRTMIFYKEVYGLAC